MKTVTFKFKKDGINKHTAFGVMEFNTEDDARRFFSWIQLQPGYFTVILK